MSLVDLAVKPCGWIFELGKESEEMVIGGS